MDTLQEFLLECAKEVPEKEIFISNRFEGRKFKIRALSNEEYERARKNAYIQTTSGKKSFNAKRFYETVCLCGVVNPDFKNSEFIQRGGCVTPEQLINKILLPGEIDRLAEEISILSGFDQDLDELVGTVKNS